MPAPPAAPRPTDMRTERRAQARAQVRSDRQLALERNKLAADEKRLHAEIKALVRAGRVAEARILSKNLVQNRNAQSKLVSARAQLGGIGNQTAIMASQQKVVDAIAGAGALMANANSAANPQRMMAVMQNYEMESGKMGMAMEMTDDVIDGVMGGYEVDDEADKALDSVLQEIGLATEASMSAAPVARPAHQVPAPVANDDALADELLKRIADLEGR